MMTGGAARHRAEHAMMHHVPRRAANDRAGNAANRMRRFRALRRQGRHNQPTQNQQSHD